MGGVRENEAWTLRLDTGRFDPVLGESYAVLGRMGLSVQRSQTAGRFSAETGPSLAYYARLAPEAKPGAREASFFDGLDTTLSGVYRLFGRETPAEAAALLDRIERRHGAPEDR
jgi:hypothetical protein